MNLNELFTTQLPLNRKERYYTGTILPQIIATDNFSEFDRFFKLISSETDLEILVTPNQTNIQFFTEYNLKESAYNNIHQSVFSQVKGDTPDLLILIITPRGKFMVAIEGKMFEPIDIPGLQIQMKEQKKVLDVLCAQLEIESQKVFHVALVPEEFKNTAGSEIKSIVSWEEVIDAYKDQSNYFLEVLKYAIHHYHDYVSIRNKSTKYEAEMSGKDIYEKYKDGTLEFKLIGRGNILDCMKQLAKDIEANAWQYRKYKISNVEVLPNGNWCAIQSFIKLVDDRK